MLGPSRRSSSAMCVANRPPSTAAPGAASVPAAWTVSRVRRPPAAAANASPNHPRHRPHTVPTAAADARGVTCASHVLPAAHKEASGCSGKRDRTAFVGRSEFDERTFLSDYRFLEEVKLADDVAKRSKPPAPKYDMPQFLQTLMYQARRWVGAMLA